MSHKENLFFNDKTFKLPIEYLKSKSIITNNIKEDLELENSINDNIKPIYNYVFQPKTELGELSIPSWSKYYTTNKIFLKILKIYIIILNLYLLKNI